MSMNSSISLFAVRLSLRNISIGTPSLSISNSASSISKSILPSSSLAFLRISASSCISLSISPWALTFAEPLPFSRKLETSSYTSLALDLITDSLILYSITLPLLSISIMQLSVSLSSPSFKLQSLLESKTGSIGTT